MKAILSFTLVIFVLSSCSKKDSEDLVIHDVASQSKETLPTITPRISVLSENDPCYQSSFNRKLKIIASCSVIKYERVNRTYDYKVKEVSLCLTKETKRQGRQVILNLTGHIFDQIKDGDTTSKIRIDLSGTAKRDENLLIYKVKGNKLRSEVTYNEDTRTVLLRQVTKTFRKNKRYASFTCDLP